MIRIIFRFLLLAAAAAFFAWLADRPGTVVRRGFEAMLKVPETEPLGLRGLFAEARQAGDIAAAHSLAERALRLNPALGWASSAMLAIQSAERDWAAALTTLENQRKTGQVAGAEA